MTPVFRPLLVTGALLAALTACSDDDTTADTIGVPRAEAGCQPIRTEDFFTPASGSHHVPDDAPLSYNDAPPAADLHHNSFPGGQGGPTLKNFYQVADRPPVPDLLHLNEHGYNVLWYDEKLAMNADAMADLEAIADAYPIDEYLVIAPWTAADGPAFPDDAHMVLTHWTGPVEMQGVWEYCTEISGEVVDDFTAEYTKANSPEPEAP